MTERWTEAELFATAARAVGKIDAHGTRGATMLSLDEIEAMAGALIVLGWDMAAPPPGAATETPTSTPKGA